MRRSKVIDNKGDKPLSAEGSGKVWKYPQAKRKQKMD
jgi:hypothetical protein